MKRQHRLAALGLVAGLLGGGAAGMALGVPGFAGAQTGDSPSTTAPADPDAPVPPAKPERGAWIRGALAPLVENGTLTRTQADAVIAALEAARPAKGPGHHGRRFGIARFFGRHLAAAADAIGVTADELRTAVRNGQSLADVARSKDVDPEKVVAALVADLKSHLDEEVAAGRRTQAEVDEKLTRVTERVRAFVNGEAPLKGFRFGPWGDKRRGPRPDDTAPPAAPSGVSPSGASVIDA